MISISMGMLSLLVGNGHSAEAHFFGGKTIDFDGKYQVTFVPYPDPPIQGDNSTKLNFSVLENNSNIYNIHSALIIAEKGSGEIIAQYPYQFFEFSDITIPYTFHEAGNYVVTLETRIIGDPKYQANPLIASFDLSVVSPFQSILSDRLTLAIIAAAAIIAIGGAIFLWIWKKM